MIAPNVLRVNEAEETEDYREAVRSILATVQAETGDTLVDIAERIGVTLGTISNALNKKVSLSPTFLKRIGQVYGCHALDPYLKLFGARALPLAPSNVRDLLPLLARANLKIAEARDPSSPGGEREIHKEKLGYLPDLKALQRELTATILKIEELAA